jgi:hypothetical protein
LPIAIIELTPPTAGDVYDHSVEHWAAYGVQVLSKIQEGAEKAPRLRVARGICMVNAPGTRVPIRGVTVAQEAGTVTYGDPAPTIGQMLVR